MSPQEKQKMEQLERRLHELERATNTSFVAELGRRLGGSNVTLSAGSLSGLNVTVRDAAGTGTEVVADDYTGAIVLTDQQGNEYTIGTY